jgi:hypothetical protein
MVVVGLDGFHTKLKVVIRMSHISLISLILGECFENIYVRYGVGNYCIYVSRKLQFRSIPIDYDIFSLEC